MKFLLLLGNCFVAWRNLSSQVSTGVANELVALIAILTATTGSQKHTSGAIRG